MCGHWNWPGQVFRLRLSEIKLDGTLVKLPAARGTPSPPTGRPGGGAGGEDGGNAGGQQRFTRLIFFSSALLLTCSRY